MRCKSMEVITGNLLYLSLAIQGFSRSARKAGKSIQCKPFLQQVQGFLILKVVGITCGFLVKCCNLFLPGLLLLFPASRDKKNNGR